MDFKSAEVLVNSSLLFNGPPLMVIGDNGIGKTEMIKTIAKKFKNSTVKKAWDYGGLQQQLPLMKKQVKTMVLTDLQNVLSRKAGVRNSTLGYMSALMTEGEEDSMSYNVIEPVKGKNINFIIAGTPQHVLRCIQLGQNDFMNRFVVIIAEREKKDFKKHAFSLDINPVYKFDRKAYKGHNNKVYKGLSQRHNEMVNRMVTQLDLMGYNGQEFINTAKPYFFDIKETVFGSRNVTTFLKPIHLEEEPEEPTVPSNLPSSKKEQEKDISKGKIEGTYGSSEEQLTLALGARKSDTVEDHNEVDK